MTSWADSKASLLFHFLLASVIHYSLVSSFLKFFPFSLAVYFSLCPFLLRSLILLRSFLLSLSSPSFFYLFLPLLPSPDIPFFLFINLLAPLIYPSLHLFALLHRLFLPLTYSVFPSPFTLLSFPLPYTYIFHSPSFFLSLLQLFLHSFSSPPSSLSLTPSFPLISSLPPPPSYAYLGVASPHKTRLDESLAQGEFNHQEHGPHTYKKKRKEGAGWGARKMGGINRESGWRLLLRMKRKKKKVEK